MAARMATREKIPRESRVGETEKEIMGTGGKGKKEGKEEKNLVGEGVRKGGGWGWWKERERQIEGGETGERDDDEDLCNLCIWLE